MKDGRSGGKKGMWTPKKKAGREKTKERKSYRFNPLWEDKPFFQSMFLSSIFYYAALVFPTLMVCYAFFGVQFHKNMSCFSFLLLRLFLLCNFF
jgi:hypothetical protein